ncbi:MAG: hydrogenase expression/formation protein HypE [Bryobacteraceae bacterium]|nr:hydrogenase expression/formation protein HypE [Bryobacteraceae bacterium]
MPPINFTIQCPAPSTSSDRIVMAHGGGGRMSQRLFDEVFQPAFANPALDARHDGALLSVAGAPLAFSTDSYVVRPLFFPGGNIGHLAVHGTSNDLAMCGARPLYLSCGFILEEGLEISTLRTVVDTMRTAALANGVQLVTGDTKVVDRGKADSLFINTAGIGLIEHPVSPARIAPGDAILVSGDLGRHGVAILSVREGLEFESPIESDCAPLWPAVDTLLRAGIDLHCLRDLTRGGLSSALNELAAASGLPMRIRESAIPVHPTVQGACEILGLDPLYVANEGRFAAFLPAAQAELAASLLPGSALIGYVEPAGSAPRVWIESRIGAARLLDMLSGEQLPRIC